MLNVKKKHGILIINWMLLLILCCWATLIKAQQQQQLPQDRIKHVVVLMQENRSFDHMLGWYQRIDPRVEGLVSPKYIDESLLQPVDGKICLPLDPRQSPDYGTFACVNDQATNDECIDDPCHQHHCTTRQIYGFDKKQNDKTAIPRMNGFLLDATTLHQNPINRISMQKPENVPIMVQLAQEFALFDRFFSSHPGPTYPNRQFVHSGTANGEVNDDVPDGGFGQKTIFEKLLKHNHEWKVYYDGQQGMTWINFLSYFDTHQAFSRTQTMGEFYADAATGNLPAYSFIEPRIFRNTSDFGPSKGLPNNQHPILSVKEGERLYKNVYEALRNGPNWNHTLFILTYDEHGGFFDHVPPPQEGIPKPDNVKAENGFDYTRLGIRIPTLLISPWIRKGTLIKEPTDAQKPFATSQWDLTSIPSTVQKLFGLKGSLTKRDAWAATFEDVLLSNGLDEPRTDCPTKLANIPESTPSDVERFQNQPLDDHQQRTMEQLCARNGLHKGCGDHLQSQDETSEFSAALWQNYKSMKTREIAAAAATE